MTPFKLYIAFDREIRNRKDGLFINTAEVTYWLNKAVQEFVDKKYAEFEGNEDVSQDLKGLSSSGSVTTFYALTNLNTNATYCSLNSDVRYITNEQVTIGIPNVSGIIKRTKITPVTLDTYNIKLKDPFSKHLLHMQDAEPLRLMETNRVILTTDGNYTITTYYYRYIKEPAVFTVQSAGETTNTSVITYPTSQLPHKAFKEIIAIAVRMCLGNQSNNRLNSHLLEENRSEL